MLGLPQSTEVNRPLPKAQLYKKFDLRSAQRDLFDADVARMDIVNYIAPQTIPVLAEGKNVKAIFVINVELKKKDYDIKNIELIAKLIPQKLIFVLHFEKSVQLVVFHSKIFSSGWFADDKSMDFIGSNIDLDGVWKNCVACISGLEMDTDNTLDDTIQLNEQRDKIRKQIESLQKRLRNCSQNRQQLDLFHQIKLLKRELALIGNK